jgi:Ni/Co efflux regulator RcnB
MSSIPLFALAMALCCVSHPVYSADNSSTSSTPLLKPAYMDRSPFLPKAQAAARSKYPDLFSGKFTGTIGINVDLNIDGDVVSLSTLHFPVGPITDRSGTKEQNDAITEVTIHNAYAVMGGVGSKFLGWFGKKRDNGLYLYYRVLKWPLDPKRSVGVVRSAVERQYPQYYKSRMLSAVDEQSESVLTVVMNDAGGIEAAKLIENASEDERSDRRMFDRFMELGLKPEQLTYRGHTTNRGDWHDRNLTAPFLSIEYAWRRMDGDPQDEMFQTPEVFERLAAQFARESATQAPDEAFVERYFESIWQNGLPKDAAGVWLLFSREGRVLDAGTTAESDHRAVEEQIRARHPGVRTNGGGSAGVRNPSGSMINFFYSWVAEDSKVVLSPKEK